jgi:hypothetical protein
MANVATTATSQGRARAGTIGKVPAACHGSQRLAHFVASAFARRRDDARRWRDLIVFDP